MTPQYIARIACGSVDLLIRLWAEYISTSDNVHYSLTKAHEALVEYRDSVTQPEL